MVYTKRNSKRGRSKKSKGGLYQAAQNAVTHAGQTAAGYAGTAKETAVGAAQTAAGVAGKAAKNTANFFGKMTGYSQPSTNIAGQQKVFYTGQPQMTVSNTVSELPQLTEDEKEILFNHNYFIQYLRKRKNLYKIKNKELKKSTKKYLKFMTKSIQRMLENPEFKQEYELFYSNDSKKKLPLTKKNYNQPVSTPKFLRNMGRTLTPSTFESLPKTKNDSDDSDDESDDSPNPKHLNKLHREEENQTKLGTKPYGIEYLVPKSNNSKKKDSIKPAFSFPVTTGRVATEENLKNYKGNVIQATPIHTSQARPLRSMSAEELKRLGLEPKGPPGRNSRK